MLLNDFKEMIVTNKVEITVIIYKVNWVIIGVFIRGKELTNLNFLSKRKSSLRNGISKDKRTPYLMIWKLEIWIYIAPQAHM